MATAEERRALVDVMIKALAAPYDPRDERWPADIGAERAVVAMFVNRQTTLPLLERGTVSPTQATPEETQEDMLEVLAGVLELPYGDLEDDRAPVVVDAERVVSAIITNTARALHVLALSALPIQQHRVAEQPIVTVELPPRPKQEPPIKSGQPHPPNVEWCLACNHGEHGGCYDLRYVGLFFSARQANERCICKLEGHPPAETCREKLRPSHSHATSYACGRPVEQTVTVTRGIWLAEPHDKGMCALHAADYAETGRISMAKKRDMKGARWRSTNT